MPSPKGRYYCHECGRPPAEGERHSRQGLCFDCALESQVGAWAQAQRSPPEQWLEIARRRLRKIDAYFDTDFLLQFEQQLVRPLSDRSTRRRRRYLIDKSVEAGGPLRRISQGR